MRSSLAGERRLARRGFATLLVLGVSALAPSLASGPGEARAAPAEPAALSQDRLGPYFQRYLLLNVPEKLEVGRPATVGVEGYADAGDELSVFVDPKGQECPSSASSRPARAIPLVDGAASEGAFRVAEAYTPRRPGDRSFCAYLTASADEVDLRATEDRAVIARRLRAPTARHTVVTALKRHGFARRVVKSVEQNCRRRGRSVFACEFSARFPGYRLTGRGRVRRVIDLSYRFRVKAQGVRFTLTDENEEPRAN